MLSLLLAGLLLWQLPPCCLGHGATSQSSSSIPRSSLLQRYVLPAAVCVDKSPGYFYAAMNASSNDFVVRLMGGSGCITDETECAKGVEEGTIHFSSNGLPDIATGFGVLSGDATENPLYSTYNRVMVPYCTQDMFVMDTESSDGEFQFRGRPYLEEVLTAVIGAQTQNSTVVLVGSSAGGVGAFNVVSWLLHSFQQISGLSVVLDSSYFFDVQGTLEPLLEYAQEDPSRAYSPICAEEFQGTVCCVQFGCMVHRGYYPRADERLRGTFVLALTQDPLPQILGVRDSDDEEDEEEESPFPALWDSATYIGKNGAAFRNLASFYPEAISVFAPSCADHLLLIAADIEVEKCSPGQEDPSLGNTDSVQCPDGLTCTGVCILEDGGQPSGLVLTGSRDNDIGLRLRSTYSARAWETVKIDGTSVRSAMEAWWEGRGDATQQVALFDSCDDLNCNPTCQTELLAGTREETDGSKAWTVVYITLGVAVTMLTAGFTALVWGWQRGAALNRMVTSIFSGTPITGGQDRPPLGPHTNGQGAQPLLELHDLSYWLPPSKGVSKQLLHSTRGTVPEGALCALMGPSGSGKSTLLDLLSGRKDYGRCEGQILFKGSSVAVDEEAYIRHAGYMRQVNSGYLEGLTVLENLSYAAMLRFPGSLQAQSERIKSAIEQTVLERSMHTKAGGLSGGLKRRLKLALELLADRQILFLDEPTSGLDANSSLELMNIMKRLSRKVTLVVAIHQPRPEVWELFSHVILLSRGRTVYCGPADNALAGTADYLLQSNRLDGEHIPGGAPKDGCKSPAKHCIGQVVEELDQSSLISMCTSASSRDRASSGSVWPGEDITQDPSFRTRMIFNMLQWESFSEEAKLDESLGSCSARSLRVCRPRNGGDSSRSNVRRRSTPPTKAPTINGGTTLPGKLDFRRSAPDKMLDRLMVIEKAEDGKLSGMAEEEQQEHGAEETAPAAPPLAKRRDLVRSRASKATDNSKATPVHPKLEIGDDGPTVVSEKVETLPVWKTAAVLLARSFRAGYGMEVGSASATMIVASAFIMFSLRAAAEGFIVAPLALSTLLCPILPALLVYTTVFIMQTRKDWELTKLELSDGFYRPVCFIARILIDHFAVAVLLSFLIVGATQVIFWSPLIISGLPSSSLVVYIQISSVVTLSGWMVIGFNDALVMTGLSLPKCIGLSNTVNTIWAVFSGSVMLVGTLPLVLRIITFSSPNYWSSFFTLRVLLDGLDLTSKCHSDSQLYCLFYYGDMLVWAFDLRFFATGTAAVAVAVSALVMLCILLTTTFIKSRSVRIIDGLEKATATVDVQSPIHDSPAGAPADGCDMEVVPEGTDAA